MHEPVLPGRAAPAWLTGGDTADEVVGRLKTGKEAEVFVVERRRLDGSCRALLAHKRYRPTKVGKGEIEGLGFTRARAFVHDHQYHEGRRFRYSRDVRAVEKMTDYGKRLLGDRWLGQELDTLTRAFEAGASVPYPVELTEDGMLMQFLGDERAVAPRLVDARLSVEELVTALDQLRADLERLTRAGIVHADLSPYNALWWEGRLWLIDFPQSVDLATNPNGFELLHHDVTTMCTWFTRRGLPVDGDELFASLLSTTSGW